MPSTIEHPHGSTVRYRKGCRCWRCVRAKKLLNAERPRRTSFIDELDRRTIEERLRILARCDDLTIPEILDGYRHVWASAQTLRRDRKRLKQKEPHAAREADRVVR